MLRIAVLGAGVMATALTFPAIENGNEVRLIGTQLDDEIIDSIQVTREHPVLELKVDERVKAYHFVDAAEAIEGADVIMSGVNSFGVDWAGEQLTRLAKAGQIILCVTKGMQADEDGTLHILPEVLKKHMGILPTRSTGQPLLDRRSPVSWRCIATPASYSAARSRKSSTVWRRHTAPTTTTFGHLPISSATRSARA